MNSRTHLSLCKIICSYQISSYGFYSFADQIPILSWLQWFALKRDHAAVVAYDDNVFPLFQKHCKVSGVDFILHMSMLE